MGFLNNVKELAMNEPIIPFALFVLLLCIYFVYLHINDAFGNKFLNFGPSEDSEFMNIKMDSWNKVITLYILSFISAMIVSYVGWSLAMNMDEYLWNPKINMMKSRKFETYLILILEPILFFLFGIITFLTMLTMEFQYMLPKFIGTYIVTVYFLIYKLSKKTFRS